MADNNLPKARHAATAGGLTAAALAAIALATQGVKPDEGYSARTYLDVAKIPTNCYGHVDRSEKVGTYHTPAQCTALLTGDVGKFERIVEKCTPVLGDKVNQLAAATRLTFNIGPGNYCQSSIARNFNAGNLKAGCNAFLLYSWTTSSRPIPGALQVRKLPNGRYLNQIRGLLLRRQREMALCLTGI